MKINNSQKITILILLILVSSSAIYGIYLSLRYNVPPRESANQNKLYDQTAIPTIFAAMNHPPVVTLNWVYANPNLLRLNLTISGLELVANVDDLENMVCNPYIRSDESISLTINSREAKLPSLPGDPIELTYEYNMAAPGYKTLTFNLDLTIGPCANYLNFQESNVTPSVTPNLIGNYHLRFQVQVD